MGESLLLPFFFSPFFPFFFSREMKVFQPNQRYTKIYRYVKVVLEWRL